MPLDGAQQCAYCSLSMFFFFLFSGLEHGRLEHLEGVLANGPMGVAPAHSAPGPVTGTRAAPCPPAHH